MLISEGGHVFKDPKTKQPLTKRINKADVIPTIKWLEKIVRFDLLTNTLGTTGKNPTSGDLDIAVDSEEHSKEEVENILKKWVLDNVPQANPKEYVLKTGIEIHFKTPINGDPNNGYVQTDLMFGDPEFMKWSSQGEPPGDFKGQHRQILLASIASSKGYRWSGFNGLTPRSGGETIRDPQTITDAMLGPGHSPQDLTSINKILDIIKDDPDYEKMVADAVATFPKYGVQFPEMKSDTRKDPPVVSLQEANMSEGPRIQHAEDLVFWEGSKGAMRALDMLQSLSTKEGQSATTLKWDGSPAVVFGRDESGQFIFTDKSGFTAKGYDGKAKSPEQLEDIFVNIRRTSKGKEVTPDYQNFVGELKQAFVIMENALPKDYRGYFFGDLLYTHTPQVVNGNYQFKPNIVTYNIKTDSDIGKKIGQSKVGVVVHREIDFEGNKTPVKNYNIFQGTELLVVPPIVAQQPIVINTKEVVSAKNFVKANASKIDDLLNQEKLRSLKISSFADSLYTYLNSKVDTGLENLGSDFLDWVGRQSSIGANAKNTITSYVNENSDSFSALWQVVEKVMTVKNNIIQQLDAQDAPVKSSIGQMQGGEGYVVANPSGDIKLVDRTGFTKANRSIQRENLLREQIEVDTVAIFPGSFKPPHKGHMAVVQYLAANYDHVYVIVSQPLKNIRSDITAQQSADIFNVYSQDLGLDNVEAIASPLPSPVGATYDIISKAEMAPNTKVVVATSSKDAGRFPQASLNKAAAKNPALPTVIETEIPAIQSDSGKPFSATDFRNTIAAVNNGQQGKESLIQFMPDNLSESSIEKIINILVGPTNQMQVTELLDIIQEMMGSSMGAGAVEGAGGTIGNITRTNKKNKRPKGIITQMTEEEKELREVIKNAIRVYKHEKIQEIRKNKLEEQQLRFILRKLILEVGDEQPIHDNTGINVLEDLLKKIIPTIQTDYKIMTTSEIQRKSFRAHILNAIQNSLKPDLYRKENVPAGTPALQEKKVKIDLEGDDEQLDKSKFIDVFNSKAKQEEEEQKQKTPEARLSAGLEKHGLDSTGRNMALQTFKKVDNSIMDAYIILDDEKDKELFYDYLITNLKLYFDKFEEEMVDMPDSEPTTPEYDVEKQKKQEEDEPV